MRPPLKTPLHFNKELLDKHNLKMPRLAMPLRVMLVGQTHTPPADAVLVLFPREAVLERMGKHLQNRP